MKKLFKSRDKSTQQAEPAATKTAKKQNPTPHDPKSDPGTGDSAMAAAEAQENPEGEGVWPRSHANAVEADRKPVAAPRSQDADPAANKGVTITTEGDTPIAHPGSTLR